MDLGPIQATVNNILTAATALGAIVLAYFLMVAGFLFMTSGGNPGRIEQSKSAAFNSLFGFGIIVGARFLAALFSNLMAPLK